MSPEQAADGTQPISQRYLRLACKLYDLLAGHPLFDDENPVKILLMHAQDPVPPIPGFDESLWEILQTGLAKKPADRFPTPADLVTRLRDWQEIQAQQQQIAHLQTEQRACQQQLQQKLCQNIENLDLPADEQSKVLKSIAATFEKLSE